MNLCRCCNSVNVEIIENATYAPFFAFKVPAILNDKDYIRFKKIKYDNDGFYIVSDSTSAILCLDCNFISPKKCFSYDELKNLYDDYRGDKYNLERNYFESNYHIISKQLQDTNIMQKRKNDCWRFIADSINSFKFENVCDFGGADGKLIPEELLKISNNIYINDVSGVQLYSDKFIKKEQIEEGSIDLGLCMHVLEHIGNPSEYFKYLLSTLKNGAFLYLEVPLEADEIFLNTLRNRETIITFHEHINKFCEKSLKHLVLNSNINLLKIGNVGNNVAVLIQK